MTSYPTHDLSHPAYTPSAQGHLFAPALLPQQLPIYKTGPEDEALYASPRSRSH